MMEICWISLDEACKFLDSRRQIYRRPKDGVEVLVIGLEDEDGKLHGVFIAERISRHEARKVHVYADGSAGGFTFAYGDAWRGLIALGVWTIHNR